MLTKDKIMITIIAIAITSSGCDMMNSIKEYFSKSKEKPAVSDNTPTPAPQEPTASVTQPKEQTASSNDSGPLPADVIARIGKWNITIDQFNDRLKAIKEVVPDFNTKDSKSKNLVLEELIRQQLLVTDAEQQGLDKKQEIQDALEEFRRTVLVREVASKLTQNVDVTDEEAKAFYDQNKASMVEPPQLHVREIKTDTEDKAKAILDELNKGADFAQTAQQKSTAKDAASGGDMGILTQLPFPEMLAPLQTLEVGKMSPVFKGPDGFYIIKLEEKKEGKPLAFEDVKKDIIQNRKMFKQQQIILDYIKQLEGKYKVETNKDLLQKGE